MSRVLDLWAGMTGTVLPFAGSAAPEGWLLCFGQAVSRTTYANLFASIGTSFGVGDGSTTFNLPDMRGRVAAGKDDMGGASAGRLTNSGTGNPGVNGTTLGASGGVDRLSLTEAQMPTHIHSTYNQSNGAITNSGGTTYTTTQGNSNTTSTSVTLPTGSGQAHPIVQPTIVLNNIIKT
jgi:microcystin-dependent protein